MRRIILMLTVAVLMAAMVALSAVPAFAQVAEFDDMEAEASDDFGGGGGGGGSSFPIEDNRDGVCYPVTWC